MNIQQAYIVRIDLPWPQVLSPHLNTADMASQDFIYSLFKGHSTGDSTKVMYLLDYKVFSNTEKAKKFKSYFYLKLNAFLYQRFWKISADLSIFYGYMTITKNLKKNLVFADSICRYIYSLN